MPEKLEAYGDVIIYSGQPFNYYELKEASLSPEEKSLSGMLSLIVLRERSLADLKKLHLADIDPGFAEKFRARVIQEIEAENLLQIIPSRELLDELKKNLAEFIKENVSFSKHPGILAEEILSGSIGLGRIGRLIDDANLEEIMINSPREEVFVFHKKHGMCRTNIVLGKRELNSLLDRIALTVGKKISEDAPLLDARLPDGSRVNATSPYATPLGATLTIRKAAREPLSIINLIENNTLSSELAAYLWVFVEGMGINPLNIICAGGSGSGKTTTLNVLSSFIPFNERIIVIEDTMELFLDERKNSVRMEARPAIQETKEVSMNDLLINALRMRPDRVIVGEVRGEEAKTLFNAMDIGVQGSMGTLHANNARETLIRLKASPMNVPEQMLPLLDLIIVNKRLNLKEKGQIRRISQVAEISRMDEQVLLANIFEWDFASDSLARTNTPSHLIEVLAEATGQKKKSLQQEILVRKAVLDFMLKRNIKSSREAQKLIQQYYANPKEVLELI
jgi:flagellar protein FlaI